MEYVGIQMNDGNYICHHGVKGQKWGKRRYQNEDGSLIHPDYSRRPGVNYRKLTKIKRKLEKASIKEKKTFDRAKPLDDAISKKYGTYPGGPNIKNKKILNMAIKDFHSTKEYKKYQKAYKRVEKYANMYTSEIYKYARKQIKKNRR